MRKQKQAGDISNPCTKNPVAKFAHQFNKAQVYADKRKYQRKAKHSCLEPFAIVSAESIANGSTALSRVIVRGI